MTRFRQWSDYFYLGTDVLCNKEGIRDADRLRAFEEASGRGHLAEILFANPVEGELDRPHMQAIHRHIFGDVYEWAGDIRVGPPPGEFMTKGGPSPDSIRIGNYTARDGFGYQYFPATDEMTRHFDRHIAALHDRGDLADLSPEQFAQALADPWAEINAAHIFREGNTRTQVVFFTYLARHYGHTLDYDRFRRDLEFRAKFNAARFRALNPANSDLLPQTLTEIVDVPAGPKPNTEAPGAGVVDDYQPHYISKAENTHEHP